ncbi:MAG: hypothetical protein WDN31_15830 [Hyphomicrobium sp.]
MFIPLRDDNELKSIPFQYVTVGLIVANVLVFILEASGLSNAAVASFGGDTARAARPHAHLPPRSASGRRTAD